MINSFVNSMLRDQSRLCTLIHFYRLMVDWIHTKSLLFVRFWSWFFNYYLRVSSVFQRETIKGHSLVANITKKNSMLPDTALMRQSEYIPILTDS